MTPTTRQEFIAQEIERIRAEYPGNEEEAYQAQAEANAVDWKPPPEKGKYEVGQTVSVDGELGSFRGVFTHADGTKYAVIANGRGQYSIPVDRVQPGNFTMPQVDTRDPHQKTWAEHRKDQLTGFMSGGRTQPTPGELQDMKKKHRNAVMMALAAGKPVPAEVLKDYPDLAR